MFAAPHFSVYVPVTPWLVQKVNSDTVGEAALVYFNKAVRWLAIKIEMQHRLLTQNERPLGVGVGIKRSLLERFCLKEAAEHSQLRTQVLGFLEAKAKRSCINDTSCLEKATRS